jgi:hypothetical protein
MQRAAQSARQLALERIQNIEHERERIQELQQQQLKHTEAVLDQQRQYLDETQGQQFPGSADGCDVGVQCADVGFGRGSGGGGGKRPETAPGAPLGESGCFSTEV